MKKIIGILLLLGLTSQAFAYSMQELEGKYRVTSVMLKMDNILTIDKSGKFFLSSEANKFNCKGKATLNNKNLINADLKCVNFFDTRTFTFAIDLSKVSNLNNFTAPLIFPMIGETKWTFERIEN